MSDEVPVLVIPMYVSLLVHDYKKEQESTETMIVHCACHMCIALERKEW